MLKWCKSVNQLPGSPGGVSQGSVPQTKCEGRSVFQKLCRSGSFVVNEEKKLSVPRRLSSASFSSSERPVVRRREAPKSALLKLHPNGNLKEEDKPSVKLTGSRSFSLKERPLVEKRDGPKRISRSGSFHGREILKDTSLKIAKEETPRSKLSRAGSFLKKELSNALPAGVLRKNPGPPETQPRSLQATVYAPRGHTSNRPSTVLIVCPSVSFDLHSSRKVRCVTSIDLHVTIISVVGSST